MRPDTRSWLACALVICAACSAIVDFPDKAPPTEDPDSGMDSGSADAASDALVDARRSDAAGDAQQDSGPPMTCATNANCDSNQLCCPSEGTNKCVGISSRGCTACNQACDNAAAPNCGARVCECVMGTGKGCEPGQLCVGQGPTARCVECTIDADCAAKGGSAQCIDSKCAQCTRGAMLDSADDDVGCSGATPICGELNTCIGCNDATPATQCPGDAKCTPGLGCAGCKLNTPIGLANNGCPDGLPICRTGSTGLECGKCLTNLDCKYVEGQGYCHELTGLCSNKCDPDATGPNGCATAAAPFCKPAPTVPGGYDCAPCASGDCTGGKFCATAGNSAGSCVQCRDNADCPQNGLSPVCDASTNTCRARTMADCAAPTPYIDTTGVCVECTNKSHCDMNPKGPWCSAARRVCGQCSTDVECPGAKPVCNPTTSICEIGCLGVACPTHPEAPFCDQAKMYCVQCLSSTNCSAAAAPICNPAGTCVACTSDSSCMAKTAGSFCVSSGPRIGECAACDPFDNNGCVPPATCNSTTLSCSM